MPSYISCCISRGYKSRGRGAAQVVEYQALMNVKKKMVEVGGFEPPSLAEARSITLHPQEAPPLRARR
jgi:predicted GNAT family acetyltransferase